MLISNKIDSQNKLIKRDGKKHFILIKGKKIYQDKHLNSEHLCSKCKGTHICLFVCVFVFLYFYSFKFYLIIYLTTLEPDPSLLYALFLVPPSHPLPIFSSPSSQRRGSSWRVSIYPSIPSHSRNEQILFIEARQGRSTRRKGSKGRKQKTSTPIVSESK